MRFSISASLAIQRYEDRSWRSTAAARGIPHMPPRNASPSAESNRNAAPSETSRARQWSAGSAATIERPNQNPPPADRHRDGIVEHITMPPFRLAASATRIGCGRARSTWGKRAPLPAANRTARTQIGRTSGSKPETLSPDERSRSRAPASRTLHSFSAAQQARLEICSRFCAVGTGLPSARRVCRGDTGRRSWGMQQFPCAVCGRAVAAPVEEPGVSELLGTRLNRLRFRLTPSSVCRSHAYRIPYHAAHAFARPCQP